MNKSKRGVSEVVSAILLLTITVAVGSILYVQIYLAATQHQTRLIQETVRADIAVKQQLRIMLVVGDSINNKVRIIVATGSYPVQLFSIYVDNALAVSYRDYYVPALTLDVIEVESPILLTKGSKILVRIVHGGGVEEAYGEVH
ncbi:MAG: archaellin/type IV pilin N-terminal domain-containing protein [Candidatus Nezhaarchaeales archaeon]